MLRDETNPGSGIVWRVRSIKYAYHNDTPTISLEHAISTLRDYVMAGEVTPAIITGTAGATTCTALEAVQFVLRHQSDWVLQDFSYGNVSNPYKLTGMDLFSALESITNTLQDAWWSYDTTQYPFRLSITRQDTVTVKSIMKASRNIRTINRTVDRTGMFTWFWPIGKDNLMLTSKNTPQQTLYAHDYITKNADLYGKIEKVATDTSLETPAELAMWANEQLNLHAQPTITIEVEGIELRDATGEDLDGFWIGRRAYIPLPDFNTSFAAQIIGLNYPDKIGQKEICKVTLSNQRKDVTKIIAETIKEAGRASRSAAKNGNAIAKSALHSATLELNETTNIYTLHLYNIDLSEAECTKEGQLNFSRATELTGEWSGGKYTVTASPQGNTHSVGFNGSPNMLMTLEANGSATLVTNTKNANVPVKVSAADEVRYTKTLTVNAADVYDTAYGLGWGAARTSTGAFPTTTGSTDNITVKRPSATVNGTAESYKYTLTSGKNQCQLQYTDANENTYNVAVYNHNKYNAGWGAACGKISMPTTESANTGILIQYPPAETVDGSALSRNYTLANDGNDAVQLFTTVVSEGVTTFPKVAKLTHGKYTSGWQLACSRVSMPTTESANTGILINYPPSSDVGGAALARNYTLANDGDDAVKLFTTVMDGETATFPAVAKLTHGKYTAGWQLACDRVSMPTTESENTGILINYPPRGTVGGTALSRNYTLANDGDDAVQLFTTVVSEGTTTFPKVAKFTHGKYTAGRNATKVGNPTWAKQASNTDVDNTVTFTTDAPSPVSGAAKSMYLVLTNGSWNTSTKKMKVSLREGSAIGNIMGQAEVDASGIWNLGGMTAWITLSGNQHSPTPYETPYPVTLGAGYYYSPFYVDASGNNVANDQRFFVPKPWVIKKEDISGQTNTPADLAANRYTLTRGKYYCVATKDVDGNITGDPTYTWLCPEYSKSATLKYKGWDANAGDNGNGAYVYETTTYVSGLTVGNRYTMHFDT